MACWSGSRRNFCLVTAGAEVPSMPRNANSRGDLHHSDARVVVANNVDSNQIFERQLGGLGFQLKQRPGTKGAMRPSTICAEAEASPAICRNHAATDVSDGLCAAAPAAHRARAERLGSGGAGLQHKMDDSLRPAISNPADRAT